MRATWETSTGGDIGDDGFSDGISGDSLTASAASGMTGLPYVRSATCTGSSSSPCSAYAYSDNVSTTWTGTTLSLYLTPSEFETPSTPARITISRNADYTEATISWELYEPVSLYEIERLEAVTVTAGDITRIEYGDRQRFEITGTIAGVEEYADATVKADITYQYRIRARGGTEEDWSEWSAYEFSGGRSVPAAPVAPTLLPNHQLLTVSWQAPYDGGNSITDYDLRYREGGSVSWTEASDTIGTDTTYIISNLTNGTPYQVQVRAENIAGESDWSPAAVGAPAPAPWEPQVNVPSGEVFAGAPRINSVSVDTSGNQSHITLTWSDVPEAQGYDIEARRQGQTTTTTLNGVSLSHTLSYAVPAVGEILSVRYRVRGRITNDQTTPRSINQRGRSIVIPAGATIYTDWSTPELVTYSDSMLDLESEVNIPPGEILPPVQELVRELSGALGLSPSLDSSLTILLAALVSVGLGAAVVATVGPNPMGLMVGFGVCGLTWGLGAPMLAGVPWLMAALPMALLIIGGFAVVRGRVL